MIRTLTPNRAIVVAVGAFILYWVASIFVPPLLLRDVFNSLAFGTSVIICLTWASSAFYALKGEAEDGEQTLILAIFLVWFVVLCQRIYVIAFNYFGRPDDWAVSAIAGFWPYSYLLAGLLFLMAPGVKGGRIGAKTLWYLIAAVGIGSLIAGILIGASISTG